MKRWIHSVTDVVATEIIDNKKIQKGLTWMKDWHQFTVESIDGNKCKISEEWINEDTGEPMRNVETYVIDRDNNEEFAYSPAYKDYAFDSNEPEGYVWWARMYATAADNYPYDFNREDTDNKYDEDDRVSEEFDYLDSDYDEEYEELDDDEYIPSSTAGDYSPGNPWDVPGMSISDFI